MRDTNPNCYVQYINKTGHIKVKELEREVEASEIIYNLSGIDEDFFLLSLFDNNQRILGLTFGNVQNLDMISFLNSDFQSVDALPEIAFLTANQYVAIVKDTQIYDINFNVVPSVPLIEHSFYDPYRHNIDLEDGNLSIVGLQISHFDYQNSFTKRTVSIHPNGYRQHRTDIESDINGTPYFDGHNYYYDILGFTLKVPAQPYINMPIRFSFDFLVDKINNIFDLVSSPDNLSSVIYLGQQKKVHFFNVICTDLSVLQVQVVYRFATDFYYDPITGF